MGRSDWVVVQCLHIFHDLRGDLSDRIACCVQPEMIEWDAGDVDRVKVGVEKACVLSYFAKKDRVEKLGVLECDSSETLQTHNVLFLVT